MNEHELGSVIEKLFPLSFEKTQQDFIIEIGGKTLEKYNILDGKKVILQVSIIFSPAVITMTIII